MIKAAAIRSLLNIRISSQTDRRNHPYNDPFLLSTIIRIRRRLGGRESKMANENERFVFVTLQIPHSVASFEEVSSLRSEHFDLQVSIVQWYLRWSHANIVIYLSSFQSLTTSEPAVVIGGKRLRGRYETIVGTDAVFSRPKDSSRLRFPPFENVATWVHVLMTGDGNLPECHTNEW